MLLRVVGIRVAEVSKHFHALILREKGLKKLLNCLKLNTKTLLRNVWSYKSSVVT